jgi:Mg2+ and Co2+ transporter CorA
MLTGLTSRNHEFISNDIKFYLRDVLDHLINMENRLEVSKEMLNNLHQTYLSRVSLGN